MILFLGADTAIDTMIDFFKSFLGSINLDVLLYVFVGIMAAIFIASIFRLIWCYENRAMRQMKRINKYLKDNPKVNDDNLVEFHQKMKKLPRRIRDRWQLFMLEREGSPSRYMTVEYCVKRPLYNSAILMVQKQIAYVTIVLAVLSLVLGMANIAVSAGDMGLTLTLILQVAIIPFICVLFGSLFCMCLHISYTTVNHNLYDLFTTFVRNIDKANNAMPDYVDYELLFTKKEIDAGIPVLREYLEKRAMEEQRLLEKAKQDEANLSPYNFADLGINGEQLMERAVQESEKFLLSKLDIQKQIDDLEKQLQKSEANMEDIEREGNRKLQAIKENLERLDKAMAETTNRVEINYNRRQATEEMNKRTTLEKDMETMLTKEKVAGDALRVEIQKRKEIIDENKKEVEEALKSEYDTFATKVYQELNERITRDNSEQMHEMEMVIARLKAKVKEFSRDIEKRDTLVEARNIELDNLRQQLNKQRNKKRNRDNVAQAPTQPAPVQTTETASEPVYTEPQYTETASGDANFVNPEMAQDFSHVTEQPVYADQQPQDMNAPFVEEAPVEQAPVYTDDYAQNPENYVETQNMEQPQQEVYYDGNGNPIYQQPYVDENGNPIDYSYENAQNYDSTMQEQPMEQPYVEQYAEQPVEQTQPIVEEPAQSVEPETAQPTEETSQEQEVPVEEKEENKEVTEESKEEKQTKRKNEKGSVKKTAKVKPAKKLKDEEVKSQSTDKEEDKKAEKDLKEAKESAKEVQADTEKAEKDADKKEKDVDEKDKKKYAENEDLVALQQQIEAENERLKKQQEELRAQIDKTLKTMEKATNATKAERTRNIKKIKELIAKLKEEAEQAKARGASKAEINKINKSAAELVKVIAEYQAANTNSDSMSK